MRRAGLLMIPNEWFRTLPILAANPNVYDLDSQITFLRQYGCSEDALRWLRDWRSDGDTMSMWYRFVSGEDETALPEWSDGSYPTPLTVEELNARCKREMGDYDLLSDLVGTVWTPSIINASAFGMVDRVGIKVAYIPAILTESSKEAQRDVKKEQIHPLLLQKGRRIVR